MKRVGACVLAFLLAFTIVCRPIKANAAIIEGTSALALGTAATQAYFQATALGWTVIEGGAAAGTSAVTTAAASYATATGAAASGDALLTSIAAGATVSGGTLILTAAAVTLLAGFAYWCYTEYVEALPAGSDALLVNSTSVGGLVLSSGTWTSMASSIKSFSAGVLGDGIAYPDSWTSPNGNVTLKWQDSGNVDYPYQIIGTANGSQFLSGTFSPSRVTPIYLFYNPAYASSGYAFVVAHQDKRFNPATWFTARPFTASEVLGSESVSIQKAGLNRTQTGYIAPPEVSETEELVIANVPDVSVEEFPDAVADAVAEGTLAPDAPVVSVPVSPPADAPDWDAPLGGDEGITEPENPGTDVPFLPDLNIPWHYVVTTIKNSAEYIALVVVVISTLLPTSLQAVLWAAVVLALLFGLIRRFLG